MVSFSFIFYSLPFSPMLWFSHSGDSFLLTNHFWKFLFSHLFFFSCCLLLLLLFFPSRVFCSLFFSFGFSCFVFFLFSATLFPTLSSLTPASLIIFFHVLWSCLIFFLSLLPQFSSPILFPAHALLCVSSLSLKFFVSDYLPFSCSLLCFFFLLFSSSETPISVFIPILYYVLLPSSPHILLFPPSLIMIFFHSSSLILFFSQPSLLSYSYSPTHLSLLQALLALLSVCLFWS